MGVNTQLLVFTLTSSKIITIIIIIIIIIINNTNKRSLILEETINIEAILFQIQ